MSKSFFKESLYPFKIIENTYNINQDRPWATLMEEINHKKKFFLLAMLPYPSGNIHCGHVRNYLYIDILARYYRKKGYAVINPLGWDSFGLPAENAAKEANINPKIWTENNIKTMKQTIIDLGFDLDWSMEIATHTPQYYHQQQKIFLDMFNAGLCYKKKGLVFWDPIENSVLSKEQVIDGKGWRSNHPVEMKIMDQWYFKLTKYVEELINDLDRLDHWPKDIKAMQKQWMAPTKGFLIDFPIESTLHNLINQSSIKVFTTKPQMLYGCTFLGLSLSHEISIMLSEINPSINEFIKTSLTDINEKDYRGINTGYWSINPLTQEKIPIYITTYVKNDFGTGAIYGVPAHNINDFNFANHHQLPMKIIIEGDRLPIANGIMINCPLWNNKTDEEALNFIKNNLKLFPFISHHTCYNLHDWSFARQRYWGCPIPLINCAQCGIIGANIKDEPVKLPEDIDFTMPGNPLDNHNHWKYTHCPQCNGSAIRETSTMDTFVDSCWYFYRYISKDCNIPIDQSLVNRLMPIDLYMGGREHGVSHLLYMRFFTKVLRDLNYIKLSEPVTQLVNQGFVCMATYYNPLTKKYIYPKDVVWENAHEGHENNINYDNSRHCLLFTTDNNPVIKGPVQKMSKSKKNIIDPHDIKETFGLDCLRFTMISDNPIDIAMEIRQDSFVGSSRFLNNVWLVGQYIYHNKGTKIIEENKINEFYNLLEKSENNLKNLKFNLWAVDLRMMIKSLESLVNDNYDHLTIKNLFLMFLDFFCIICPYISLALEELLYHDSQKIPLMNKNFEKFEKFSINEYNNNILWKIMINNKFKDTLLISWDIDNEPATIQRLEEHFNIKINKIFIIKNKLTINIIK